jgi:flagellar biogenesis protein FliO
MADQNDQVEVTTNEARAGSTPRMTRYILAISLVLIIVIFAILLFARQ